MTTPNATFSLRRRPPAAAPPAPEDRPNPLPLAAGRAVLRTTREKRELEELGFDQAAAVPGDLAEIIAREQAKAAGGLAGDFEAEIAELERRPQTFQMPDAADLADLPPARQASLGASVRAAVGRRREAEEAQALAAQLPTALREAARTAAGVEAFDSRPAVTGTGPAAGPPGPQARPEPAPAPAPAPAAPPPAAAPAPEFEPVDLDVHVWVAAQLHDGVFRKEFPLFGGGSDPGDAAAPVHVTLRTLTVDQLERVHTQLSADGRDGLLLTIDDYIRRQRNYTTTLALERVVVGDRPIPVAREVDAALAEKASLRDVFADLVAQPPFKAASLWRVMAELYRRLELTVDRLERLADKPNFSTAIRGPR